MNRCTKENCPMNAETLNPDCDLKSCPYRTEISGDLISREETLNKINDLIAEYIPLMPIGWTLPLNIAKTLNELPSVTPQQQSVTDFADKCKECGKILNDKLPTRWIPCSERLPEKEGYYLVTATNHFTGEIGVFISWLETDIYEDGKWGSAWCNNHTENTIAWMPLPESYKVESEENNDDD